jgi:three-Cys-motif partner protein
MTEDFHNTRSDWGRIKHQILKSYIHLYVGKLGSIVDRVYYVDGFAGQGVYDDNQVGSAFIGAETAAVPVQKSRKDALHCINVEEDDETFQKLEKALAEFSKTGQVQNFHGTFHDKLPEILRIVGNAPAFFFIDPFGSKGVEIDTLKQIRQGRERSEILVRYDDTRVKRLLSWAVNNIDSLNQGHSKSALNFAKRVNQLTDEQAIAELDKIDGKTETREILIAGYKNKAREVAGFKFALHYPIKNPRTGGHKYYLVHFCNHPDGYHYMANFMAKAERAYLESQRQHADLFSGQTAQEVMPGILEEADRTVEDSRVTEILASLPEILSPLAKTVEMRRIYAAIVDKFGWRATRKEWIRALRLARDKGSIAFDKSDDSALATINR